METERKTNWRRAVNLNETPKLSFPLESVQRFYGCKFALIDVETQKGTFLQICRSLANYMQNLKLCCIRCAVCKGSAGNLLSKCVLKYLEVSQSFYMSVGPHLQAPCSRSILPDCASPVRAVFAKTLTGAPLRHEDEEQFTILRNKSPLTSVKGSGLAQYNNMIRQHGTAKESLFDP
jgi:hypothetical protein